MVMFSKQAGLLAAAAFCSVSPSLSIICLLCFPQGERGSSGTSQAIGFPPPSSCLRNSIFPHESGEQERCKFRAAAPKRRDGAVHKQQQPEDGIVTGGFQDTKLLSRLSFICGWRHQAGQRTFTKTKIKHSPLEFTSLYILDTHTHIPLTLARVLGSSFLPSSPTRPGVLRLRDASQLRAGLEDEGSFQAFLRAAKPLWARLSAGSRQKQEQL